MSPYFQLFAVAAVVMGISHTIAKEKIFEPLRERLGGHDTWLGYLVSCPYCCSHWVSFLLVPLTGTYFIPVPHDWWFVDDVLRWFLSSILVVVIAAFFRVVFYFVDETQGLKRRVQKKVEAETELTEQAVETERVVH